MILENIPSLYPAGLAVAFAAIIIAFFAMFREKEDIHKLIIVDLIDVSSRHI